MDAVTPVPIEVSVLSKFAEWAFTQGPEWVVTLMAILAVVLVIREYSRRELFWKEREAALLKALEDKDEALSCEKDNRHTEGMQLVKEGTLAMAKLVEMIQRNEQILNRVTDTLDKCHEQIGKRS